VSHRSSASKATRKKRKSKRPRPLRHRKIKTGVVTKKRARQIAAALAYFSIIHVNADDPIERIIGLSKPDQLLVEAALEAILARLWKQAGTYTLEWKAEQ
jgi:hypothetical protein